MGWFKKNKVTSKDYLLRLTHSVIDHLSKENKRLLEERQELLRALAYEQRENWRYICEIDAIHTYIGHLTDTEGTNGPSIKTCIEFFDACRAGWSTLGGRYPWHGFGAKQFFEDYPDHPSTPGRPHWVPFVASDYPYPSSPSPIEDSE